MKDIHINGYYITADEPNIKIPLESQDKIYLFNMSLIELVLPECKQVWCNSNKLTELIIPQSCEYINCTNNKLSKLTIPKSCQTFYFYGNKLPLVIENLFNSMDPIKIALANSLQQANSSQLANNIQLVNNLHL
jgi:hypothetical protein